MATFIKLSTATLKRWVALEQKKLKTAKIKKRKNKGGMNEAS
jgi:hypothetical protein